MWLCPSARGIHPWYTQQIDTGLDNDSEAPGVPIAGWIRSIVLCAAGVLTAGRWGGPRHDGRSGAGGAGHPGHTVGAAAVHARGLPGDAAAAVQELPEPEHPPGANREGGMRLHQTVPTPDCASTAHFSMRSGRRPLPSSLNVFLLLGLRFCLGLCIGVLSPVLASLLSGEASDSQFCSTPVLLYFCTSVLLYFCLARLRTRSFAVPQYLMYLTCFCTASVLVSFRTSVLMRSCASVLCTLYLCLVRLRSARR